MDVQRILHMKQGLGEASYAQNSSLQKKSIDALQHIINNSAIDAYTSQTPETLAMADLGCSSGPNTLSIIRTIIDAINRTCTEASKASPEFMVFLNDLPTNDFNSVFATLPEFIKNLGCSSVFMAGVPGSFYGRLFPNSSLHFISSCYSLHWLSQVPQGLFNGEGKPINKGKMCISNTSPAAVAEAYSQQFRRDFSLFLRSRSEELISGGKMVLIMLGRNTDDHCDRSTNFLWEVLAQSFAIMVSQELVEEERVDSYNVPFYAPSFKEIEDEAEKVSSFTIDHIRVHELNISTGTAKEEAEITSMAIRAIQESMITHHFGEGVIETLFQYYRELLSEAMAKEERNCAHLVVVLRKMH
ncbi:uncharacterized protein A4U43_C01F3810 [Asparagus officinalis]|uniref:Uncharacterized protein n=1 Tax=Asparagus officinalis TaxID=4686 RepID=A0A5P1FP34_ASPOF|nr:salicylate carboxymethyltransferase-like [Asparagus officinalis]ONK79187.1 uncharacterized protein A4U43_C01F3810 [Asparagus officinalis]